VPAGWYDVHVYHVGRSEAEETAETLDRELQHLGIPQRVAEFERRGGGIERYVIRLWPRRWPEPGLPPQRRPGESA